MLKIILNCEHVLDNLNSEDGRKNLLENLVDILKMDK
jgi:hypothetical protein